MSKKRIETRCEYCGESAVYAHPSKEKLTIRCRACQRTIYTFYTDPTQAKHTAQALSDVEATLLKKVTLPARALYEQIRRFYLKYSYAPTIREITAAMGWRSTNTTRHHLAALEKAGLIERDYGAARGIRLLYV